ncbi:ABC transporter substrate-binding protein [Devosia riboflavina]
MAQTAFAPAALTPDEVGAGPRLIYLHNEYPSTLDPQNTSAFVGQLAMEMFDTLVTYEIDPTTGIADQTKIVPRLAESWEISDDNKTLTFHLNPAAKFWDGSAVTADAPAPLEMNQGLSMTFLRHSPGLDLELAGAIFLDIQVNFYCL